MSEAMRMYLEVGFNLIYLTFIWILAIMMTIRIREVPEKDYPVANLFRWAFLLLAIGDTGHVGFRVAAFAMGGLEQNTALIGIGSIATAVTITVFYLLLLFIWKARFDSKFGWFQYLIVLAAIARFVIMAFPQNTWGSTMPSNEWRLARNLCLIVQGVGILILILRDAYKNDDKLFRRIGYCILWSYIFYVPTVFWGRSVPGVSMLMIPKTIMYIIMAFLVYFGLWPRKSKVNTQ
jgi:hypothetical protein